MKSLLSPCARGGHCCRGRGRTVVDPEDTERLAEGLGISPAEFYLAHTERRDGLAILKATGADLACVFLTDEGCRVYAHRPHMCRTWPLWPEIAETPERFAEASRHCAMLKGVSREDLMAEITASGSP